MKYTDKQLKEITKLLEKVDEKRRILSEDKRASASYWNGDDWGSISGHRDAAEWVNDQLAELVLDELKGIL
jgi:hypothetical protein